MPVESIKCVSHERYIYCIMRANYMGEPRRLLARLLSKGRGPSVSKTFIPETRDRVPHLFTKMRKFACLLVVVGILRSLMTVQDCAILKYIRMRHAVISAM